MQLVTIKVFMLDLLIFFPFFFVDSMARSSLRNIYGSLYKMNNICDLSGIIILIEHHIHQNLSKIYGGARLVGHDLAYLPPSYQNLYF